MFFSIVLVLISMYVVTASMSIAMAAVDDAHVASEIENF